MVIVMSGSCASRVESVVEPLHGHWEGAAVFQGAELKISVDFEEGSEGLRASLSSPDLLWFKMPLAAASYNAPRVHFEVPLTPPRTVFEGTVKGKTIEGYSLEGGQRIPFSLRQVSAVPEQPPYRPENVQFRNADVTLSGTLLVPSSQQKQRHPAVVFLHGAGEHPRQDYLFYADQFARRGIAALVYDKRGVGDSTGNMRTADQHALVSDALAAVELLKGRDDIDAQRIGLWGHSLGGMVAPIAASRSVDAAFLILIAPPGVTLGEAEAWDDEFNLRKQGFPDDVIARSNQINAQLNEYLRTGKGRAEIETALQNARREKWFAQTDLPETAPSSRASSAYGGLDFDLNPLPFFQKVKVPLLVVFGELDNRIPPQKSVAQIEQALKDGGNVDFDIKIFPGADHSIRLPNGKRPDTGGKWDWARIAPGYMETVLDWTQKRVGLSQK
jgi:hypothetical protein